MNNGKRSLAALLALLALVSFAPGNGLNLNSLGTRALTMGGAFVGLADDFSVVFWNPAGAADFRSKYFGFYGTDLIPTNKYRMDVPLEGSAMTLVDAKSKMTHYLDGMAAYYHPVSDRLVLGIGVYTPSGLGANWEGSDFAALTGSKSYDWTSKIGMVSISPLIAYKINDVISVGATLNLNYGTFSIKMHAGEAELPVPPYVLDLGQYEESMSGWGLGATFGLRVKASQALSFGLTVRTPTAVKFKGEALISNVFALGYSGTSGLHRDLTFPLWIAGGVAVRPVDRLLLTADIQWTGWSKIKALNTDFTDPAWKALMRLGGQDVRKMDWSDRAQLRFGAEYLLSRSLALRAGCYHDPTPSPDTTMNVLLPSFTFNVVTCGIGYKVADLELDFGLEYLTGKERGVDYIKTVADPAFESAMPGTYKMRLIVPNVSVGFRF